MVFLSKNNLIFFIFFLLFNFIILSSCTAPQVAMSGATTTAVVAEGDKSLGNVIDDASIKVQITNKFISNNKSLFLNIDSKVQEGRVLLTGIVEKQEDRIEAIKLVWEISGVNEVINEIEVGEKVNAKEYAQDLWISTQAKALAAKELGMSSLSFNFDTIRGKIFVTGITKNKDNLDSLISNLKTIKGVKEIVNYVILKN